MQEPSRGLLLGLLPAVAASSCKLGWRPAGQTLGQQASPQSLPTSREPEGVLACGCPRGKQWVSSEQHFAVPERMNPGQALESDPRGLLSPGCMLPLHAMRTNGKIPKIVKAVSFPSLRTVNGLRRKDREGVQGDCGQKKA